MTRSPPNRPTRGPDADHFPTDATSDLEREAFRERIESETDPASVRRSNIAAATAVAETLRTTLGPNGRHKMLVGRQGRVVVTNDGANVLKNLEIADPVARAVVEVAEAQEAVVGDGTTTAVLLTGALLDAAASLLEDGLHPTTVVSGYGTAVRFARDRLDEYETGVDRGDDETLRAVARTAVTNDWDDASIDRFAYLAVSAARAVDFETASIARKSYAGAPLEASELIDGLVVDLDASSTTIERDRDGRTRAADRSATDARIALVDHEIGVQEADAVTTPTVTDPDELERLRESEREERSRVVDRCRDRGVDVLVCQQSVDERIRETLEREGLVVAERTRRDEFDALAAATGAQATYSIADLDESTIGRAGTVERRTIGASPVLVVANCPSDAHASLLLRGGTPQVADETRRIVDDCLAVTASVARDGGGAVVPGGGATPMALAQDLSRYASRFDKREQLAVDAFATALESIPRTLATNAGRDPIDVVAELRAEHDAGRSAAGVDANGGIADTADIGVLEPRAVLDRTLAAAFEATAAILRIDGVLAESARSATGQGPSEDGHDRGHEHANSGARASIDGYPWAIGH
ncbi:thermosome subunit beta [Halopiger xanaduensis]|uniref:Chaperonin Cpn60/TCP-1 n=1 Tax=Halopiger xanaduensis (strain DSM 18323 / JCM 14033 / SH-6) TaxID=797210 RepID=F8D3I2_HALXS|nr:thermosome subunit beta [Halopiger xanaduensis]AEH36210.1 chaperonin Cpn60/TCP-1 [Halopiger xanaduensis SH-6]